MSDTDLQNFEGVALVALVVAFVLYYLILRLRRSRPELRIGAPVAVAFGIRLAAIAGIGSTGLSSALRGGDETTFLSLGNYLAAQPLGTDFLPHGPYQLQTVLFALQTKLGFIDQGAMRITQVGIALIGVVLIIGAVYDLAGGRAARIAAWLLAFEPTSIFFDSELHKDPLMMLATGLFVFGGTMVWKRLDIRGFLLWGLGGVIAVETRSYAGWFLVSAAVLLLLHAALRGLDRPMRAMPLIYAVAIIGFVATPVLLDQSSTKNLKVLQESQDANASGAGQGSAGENSSNLALEQVNFSSRSAIITNLPQRIRDVLLRPYPWQLGDPSQRFGAVGTLVAYALLLLFARFAWLSRGHVFSRAGPMLYPLMFLLVAYSLSAGNAGTSFRYRTHIVTLGIAIVVILREHVLAVRSTDAAAPAEALGLEPPPRRTAVAAPV
jgi:hypothetical protein